MGPPEERLSPRKKLSVGLLTLLVILNGYPSSAFVFKTGECRSITKTVENFDLGQFLGTWYVIQSSNTAARCHTISIKDKSGSFAFTVNKQLYSLLAAGIVHNLHYEAQVYPNPQRPASMVVRMPSSLYSDVSYEVIGTDYKSWAVMWACKNQMFGHLESGMILSRTTTLPIESLTLIREDLLSLGVSKLSTVQQKDCNPKLGGGFFTLELASGLTNVPVNWETLIPQSQVPSAITGGCFVQEGQYFYFREVCPSASTGSNSGSANNTGEYYYYYYDDPAALVDGAATDSSSNNGQTTTGGAGSGEYYYYYEDSGSGTSLYTQNLDGSGDEYYDYTSSGSGDDSEYYNYYYDDEYSGDEYYTDDYYSDYYYDDEYATEALQMRPVERDYEDLGEDEALLDYADGENDRLSQILPEVTAGNWTHLWNTFSRGLDETDWKVEGDTIVTGMMAANDIPGENGVSETENAIKGVTSFEINERPLPLRMKRGVNSKEMKEDPLGVMTMSNGKGEAGLSLLADNNTRKGKLLQVSGNKIDLSLKESSKQSSDKNIKLSTGKKPGGKKKNKAKSKKKRRMRKKKKGRGKNNKRRKKNKNKKRRRRRRKKGRKGGKNKRKNNPLVARLIMMSGKLQKFLMTHNIDIRKIPVKLRLKDLYPYFKDKQEKRRLRRLLGRARRIWGSKVKRTAKKKGKKNMKIFKNKITWKQSKKSGKRRRRNKGKRRKSKRRRKKGKWKKNVGSKAKQKKKKNIDTVTNIRKKVGNNENDLNVAIKKLGKLKRREKKPEVPERKDEITDGTTKKSKRRKKNGGKGKLSKRERRKRRKKIRKAMRKKMKRKMKKKLKERKRGKKRNGNKKNRKKNKRNKKRNKKNKKKKKNKNKNKHKLLDKRLDTNEKKNRKNEKAERINEGMGGRNKKNKEMEKLFKEIGVS